MSLSSDHHRSLALKYPKVLRAKAVVHVAEFLASLLPLMYLKLAVKLVVLLFQIDAILLQVCFWCLDLALLARVTTN